MSLNGQPIANNSIVLLSSIGEGDAGALLCTTDRTACCTYIPNRAGEWYYPDGMMVSTFGAGQPYYRNRGTSMIRLNRRPNMGLSVMYTGIYCCEIPDQNNVMQTLCVGAYLTESAGECFDSTYVYSWYLELLPSCGGECLLSVSRHTVYACIKSW